MKNKMETSGFATLIMGVVMLAITFISAFLFLSDDLGIIASSDLMGLFGEALAPLISTVMRVMYLGIMGWIGSLLTMRGIQILTRIRWKPSPEVKTSIKPEAELDAVLKSPNTSETTPAKQRSRSKIKGKKGE